MEPDISDVHATDIPVAVVLVERETGSICSVNDQFCEQFDLDRDAVEEEHVSWLTADSWSPADSLADRLDAVDEDAVTEFEWHCRYGTDGACWARVSVTAGTIDGDYAVLACQDVSEYRDKEAELEYRSALLEAQAEATIDGFLVVNEDREIVSYNTKFLDIWEMSEDIVEEGSDREALDAILDTLADPDEFIQRVEYLYENPEAESRDEIRLEDGRWLDRYSAPVVGDDGAFYGRLWVFRDITERKDREQRLEEFASVVSHDLRNPLDVAIGRIDVLDDVGDVPEDLEPHIEEVETSLHRMARLIDDLLTLTKQGGNVSQTDAVDLESIAENAWGNVATEEATLAVETDLTIQADSSRLVQMLENLFRNAIEHAGEEVTITVGRFDGTDAAETDQPAGFYVADDGQGIPASDREHIFDYGFTTSDEGTGFGLAIVTDIARGHDWQTTVTESEDGGARFEFRID